MQSLHLRWSHLLDIGTAAAAVLLRGNFGRFLFDDKANVWDSKSAKYSILKVKFKKCYFIHVFVCFLREVSTVGSAKDLILRKMFLSIKNFVTNRKLILQQCNKSKIPRINFAFVTQN